MHVLYYSCFAQLKVHLKINDSTVIPYNQPLRGFTNHAIQPKEMVKLLAQKSSTLVLMMNSCSYSTNDLVLIQFQIFDCVQLQRKIRSQVLKLARIDLRTHASRSHQGLKEESSSWIKFGPSQDGEEVFQEKIFKTCVIFVSVKILFVDRM